MLEGVALRDGGWVLLATLRFVDAGGAGHAEAVSRDLLHLVAALARVAWRVRMVVRRGTRTIGSIGVIACGSLRSGRQRRGGVHDQA